MWWVAGVGVVLLSFMSTTKEQRAAARAKHHPWDKIAFALALLLAATMFIPAAPS